VRRGCVGSKRGSGPGEGGRERALETGMWVHERGAIKVNGEGCETAHRGKRWAEPPVWGKWFSIRGGTVIEGRAWCGIARMGIACKNPKKMGGGEKEKRTTLSKRPYHKKILPPDGKIKEKQSGGKIFLGEKRPSEPSSNLGLLET